MSYSDKELKEATQIAYIGFLKQSEDNLRADGKKKPFSLRELISSYFDIEAAKRRALLDGKNPAIMKLQELIKFSDLKDGDKLIIEDLTDQMLDWKIVDIHDRNAKNGFYGCVIETDEKNAIVAFRGSENIKIYSNLKNDWIKADLALLNSEETEQQVEAEKFADKLLAKGTLDKYDSLAVTGHSLGGNLASHFTVACAENGRAEIFDKINQSVNMDGPGVSDEYIASHRDLIDKASGKMKHYKWSAVGALLNDIPGEETEFLGINNDLFRDNLIDRIKYKVIYRHSTKSLEFDPNGNAKRGKQDLVSKALSSISKSADNKWPAKLTTELLKVAEWIMDRTIGDIEYADATSGATQMFMEEEEKQENRKENTIGNKLKDILGNMTGALREGACDVRDTFGEMTEGVKNSALCDVMEANKGNNRVNISRLNEATNLVNENSKDKNDRLAYAQR